MTATQRTHLYGAGSSESYQRIALTSGDVPVAVYGLGKMGLPLAATFADVTGNVTGVDVSESVVRSVNEGRSHVVNEPGLDDLVARTVADGSLRAVTDGVAAAEHATVHAVIVPTPITDDHRPDLSLLEAATRDVAAGLSPGDTVFVECTVPPGTTREVVRPTLAAESGLSPDRFGVAFCPERTKSGRALRDIRRAYPKVVGGVDEESTRVADLFYGQVTENDVIAVSDATTAEAVKLFGGLYRDVNIALANELARIRDDLGIDVREAIETANTTPIYHLHDPGAGVGGHCIPYYPYFVMSAVDADTPLLRIARQVNDAMPRFAVEKLEAGLAEAGLDVSGATVAVLGLTYRPGVEETRATPARPIVDHLAAAGAEVLAVDPVLDDFGEFDAEPVAVDALPERDLDAAVLVTGHEEFHDVDWSAFDPMVVVDGRDALALDGTDHRVYTIGRG
ncbi:MAG: nucleotide sugar dehydrogenase [Halorientalis sp.]